MKKIIKKIKKKYQERGPQNAACMGLKCGPAKQKGTHVSIYKIKKYIMLCTTPLSCLPDN